MDETEYEIAAIATTTFISVLNSGLLVLYKHS